MDNHLEVRQVFQRLKEATRKRESNLSVSSKKWSPIQQPSEISGYHSNEAWEPTFSSDTGRFVLSIDILASLFNEPELGNKRPAIEAPR